MKRRAKTGIAETPPKKRLCGKASQREHLDQLHLKAQAPIPESAGTHIVEILEAAYAQRAATTSTAEAKARQDEVEKRSLDAAQQRHLQAQEQLTSAQSCLEQARRALEAAQREACAACSEWLKVVSVLFRSAGAGPMVVPVALGEQTPPGGWQWVADDLPAPVSPRSTSPRSPKGCSSQTVQPVVTGLDGTDADLREFIDLKVGNILQRLEGQEKLLESISHRLEKGPETWKAQPLAGRWSTSRRPSASMAAGLMPIGSGSGSSSYALDLVPISPRNSNPSSSHGGAMHFAMRMRQSNHDLQRKGSMMAEEFASYSRTDAQMLDAAKDHGVRQMVAAVERMRVPDAQVRRSRSTTIRCFQAMVTHPSFDVFFAALVAVNTIFMGVDVELELADQAAHGESVALSVMRRSFTAAFTVELVLRIVAYGWDFFCRVNFWNWLDTVIVMAGLVESAFAVIQAAEGANTPSMLSLRALRILRITRMLKIIRVLRIFRFVLALRTLVQSTIHTLKSLFWALVLLGLIIYVFALVFTEVTADTIRDLRANGADGDQQSDALKLGLRYPSVSFTYFAVQLGHKLAGSVDGVRDWGMLTVREAVRQPIVMICACLFDGPSDLPVYWSCPLALPLGLPCLRGLFSGLAWLFWVFAPVGFLFAVLVGFSLGWVWRPVLPTPWNRLLPLGLCPRCSWRAFVVGCRCCCCGCPPRSALSIWGQFRSKFTHVTAEVRAASVWLRAALLGGGMHLDVLFATQLVGIFSRLQRSRALTGSTCRGSPAHVLDSWLVSHGWDQTAEWKWTHSDSGCRLDLSVSVSMLFVTLGVLGACIVTWRLSDGILSLTAFKMLLDIFVGN
eukprot:s1276_g6.t1